MKLMITSHRGHHEADVLELEVSKAIFNKMTGKSKAPLPEEYKVKVPDNFQELENLWKESEMGYTPIAFDKKGDLVSVKEFNPEANEIAFLAPVTGG